MKKVKEMSEEELTAVRKKRAEYAKKWREKNPDKHKECVKRYRAKHRDKINKYQRDLMKRPDQVEKRRKYQAEHRDYFNKKSREYYAKNPSPIKARNRKYYAKNRELLCAKQNYKMNKKKYEALKNAPKTGNILEAIQNV